MIVSEYIDEFFRYCVVNHDFYEIKNKIARAYLNNKLKDDNDLIEQELNKKLSITLEPKRDLINAHLK